MSDGIRDLLFALSITWPCGLAAVLLIFALLLLRVYLFSHQRRRHLTRYCHRCRYDLNHNTTGRCPECGRPIPAEQRAFLDRQRG